MKTLLYLPAVILQIAVLLLLYWAASIGLFYLVAPLLPGYYEDAALADMQAILLTLLLWDRFFGPYSHLLRGVAKTLKASRKQREH